MEDATWEQKIQAVTHVLTSPTAEPPSLHAQFLMATQLPCYLRWDYPPVLCPRSDALAAWSISLFLGRLFGLQLPQTSWRARCPYQQPPPLVLAAGVEEARWSPVERKEYVRRRLRRPRLGCRVSPWIPFLLPNSLLVCLLLWNPFPQYD